MSKCEIDYDKLLHNLYSNNLLQLSIMSDAYACIYVTCYKRPIEKMWVVMYCTKCSVTHQLLTGSKAN